jgi:DNA-binding transcriptional LysR family regulator
MKKSLQSLRIADLELFITAARLKSLGRAAEIHHLSQSAASTAIKRVETAFEKPLCTHERRQFCLTAEGKLFLRVQSYGFGAYKKRLFPANQSL